MSSAKHARPIAVLFGYDSSAFTQKVRLVLRLKQIPYTFVTVPSMMPRPILKDYFNLTYRKIPVLALGRDIYADTSVIIEALEHRYPASEGYGTMYPRAADGRSNRSIIRGFASYWTDRPFFRAVCGLMPTAVWRSHFGVDRAGLIGHKLDPDKLEKKIPQCLSATDMHLSLLEPQFLEATAELPWILSTKTPSLADLAYYYMLKWGEETSRGVGINNLTGGEAADGGGAGCDSVLNSDRYPGVTRWFERLRDHLDKLPSTEHRIEGSESDRVDELMSQLANTPLDKDIPMVPTPASQQKELDERNGLGVGAEVSIAPDDTGREDPTLGKLVALGPEEVVITPQEISGAGPRVGEVRLHFPRIHFVIRPNNQYRAVDPRAAKL